MKRLVLAAALGIGPTPTDFGALTQAGTGPVALNTGELQLSGSVSDTGDN